MTVPERQARFRELLERSHARRAGIARAYTEYITSFYLLAPIKKENPWLDYLAY
jgi:hypothetical protein